MTLSAGVGALNFSSRLPPASLGTPTFLQACPALRSHINRRPSVVSTGTPIIHDWLLVSEPLGPSQVVVVPPLFSAVQPCTLFYASDPAQGRKAGLGQAGTTGPTNPASPSPPVAPGAEWGRVEVEESNFSHSDFLSNWTYHVRILHGFGDISPGLCGATHTSVGHHAKCPHLGSNYSHTDCRRH